MDEVHKAELQARVDKAMRSEEAKERAACRRMIDLGFYPEPTWTQKIKEERHLKENLKQLKLQEEMFGGHRGTLERLQARASNEQWTRTQAQAELERLELMHTGFAKRILEALPETRVQWEELKLEPSGRDCTNNVP